MEWRAVPGWEGKYEVSDMGQVRSIKGGRRLGKILTQHLTHDGYPRLRLVSAERGQMYTVHILVAAAFLGPRPDGYTVNHKDGVKVNSRLSNLEYISLKANHEHAALMGLHARGERQGSAKMTIDTVRDLRQRYDAGESAYKLAKEFGISAPQAWNIIKRKHWGWVQ